MVHESRLHRHLHDEVSPVMMNRRSSDRVGCQYAIQLFVSVAATAVVVAGCSDPADDFVRQVAARVSSGPWHQQHGWKAADFFADPKVVALGDAIVANDLDLMKELIAAGTDVNARGKGNMTPLLWAFFDNKPERFRLLLEAGADPNVFIESDFGLPHALNPGDSVTHMACRSEFGHFWDVFAHGGDPNLPNKEAAFRGETPVYSVIKSAAGDKKERIARLAELGASLNRAPGVDASPLVTAEGYFGRYDLCLLLIDLGADPRQYEGNELTKITHLLCGRLADKARGTGQLRDAPPQKLADFDRLVQRLEAMGESMAAAQADRVRWSSVSDPDKRYAMRRREIAERKEREKREREAAQPNGQVPPAPDAPPAAEGQADRQPPATSDPR